jgi:hypothetical protein
MGIIRRIAGLKYNTPVNGGQNLVPAVWIPALIRLELLRDRNGGTS